MAGQGVKLVIGGDSRGAVRAAKETENAGTKLKDHFSKLGGAIAGGLAVGAVLEFGKASVEAAASEQKSQALLANQIKNSTGARKVDIESVSNWVDAQARATGVSKEQLYPALTSLVRVTHDVGKAQSLLTLAQNISASTGKPLTAVTLALAKAQNGSLGGLTRLGIKIKQTGPDLIGLQKANLSVASATKTYTDAVKKHGQTSDEAGTALKKLQLAQEHLKDVQDKGKTSTKGLAAVMQDLQKQFAGGSATAANTFQGKMARLNVQFTDVKEKIGTALIPVITKLATVLMGVITWLEQNKAAMIALGVIVGGAIVVAFIAAATAITGIAIALGAIVVGITYAYTHFETFKNIVDTTVTVVRTIISGFVTGVIAFWHTFGNTIVSFLKGKLDSLKLIVQGAMDFIRGIIKVVTSLIHGDWSGVWNGIKQMFRGVWESIKGIVGDAVNNVKTVLKLAWEAVGTGVKNGWKATLSFFTGLPGQILGFLDSLPGKFLELGGKLIQKLIDGIKAGISSAGSAIGNMLGGLIPHSIGGIHIPFTATGGIVTGPQVRVVGEAGPEAIIPLSKMASMGFGGNQGSTSNVTLNIQVYGVTNAADVAPAIKRWVAQNGGKASLLGIAR